MKSGLNRLYGMNRTVICLLVFLASWAGACLAKPADDLLKIEKKHDRWIVSFAPSAVTLKIPDADSFTTTDMRALSGPSYFYFTNSGGITLSGWFEPRVRYEGLLPYWKSESARFYANPTTAPVKVIFAKIGQWELVVYDQPFTVKGNKGALVNLHAELAKAGTWIDIHMSKGTTAEEAEAARSELIDIMERVQFEIAPGAIVSPQEIAGAVADLTDKIEGLDDRGYEKALAILGRYLFDLPAGSYPVTQEAHPWRGDPQVDPSMQQMLDHAFVASLIQDDLQHRTEDRLYRAWQVVLKYYVHYIDPAQLKKGERAWPRAAILDKLLQKEKDGQLRQYAQTVPLLRKVSTPEVVEPAKPKT